MVAATLPPICPPQSNEKKGERCQFYAQTNTESNNKKETHALMDITADKISACIPYQRVF
ncbi:hypothetical protein CTT30_22820 (plasmid) [Vibrio coralliilyticus]|nr:hypothetical protein CTT30_22820 [Vibrio coralliilyticus]